MARYFPIPFISLVASLAMFSPSPAQATGEHKMTPEQQAAMEAYTKAATPGPQHAALAKQVGNYSLLIKSTQDLSLVGLDVVEIAPPLDPSEATVFAGLKIIMEYIAVIARQKQKG